MFKKMLWLTFYSLPVIAFCVHSTEPRAASISPAPAQADSVQVNPRPAYSLPAKVTVYKSRQAELANMTRSAADEPKLPGGRITPQLVKAYVRTEAVEHGVNPSLALWIVKHESHFDPRAKGDGEASRGLWQISKIYHPEVSDAMAFNVASSTNWSLERIRSGKANEWSTYRFCRTLYRDCPF